MNSTPVGLCATCRCARVVETRTGSRFYLCRRSATDPRFPRYPRLPVLRCAGYDPEEEPTREPPRPGSERE